MLFRSRLEQLLEPHESAAAPAERGDVHRELMQALHTLPAEQRAALVLVDMQAYPVAEAARILEVPAGTVKSRCARGRARLLPLLAHLRGEERGEDRSEDRGEGMGKEGSSGGRNRTQKPSVPEASGPRDTDAVKDGGGRA